MTHKTNKEFFSSLFKKELPIFMKVFKAVEEVPVEKHSYKHDPKSKSTLELISHTFALEAKTLPGILRNGKVDFTVSMQEQQAETVSEAAQVFEVKMNEAQHIIDEMTDEEWASPAAMLAGGKPVWETTKGDMMWSMLFDLVHHRGQLSTFIRPMGGKVPSIYGPSADTQ